MPVEVPSAYLRDILDQPGTLRASLREPLIGDCADLIRSGERIVFTGMGASFAALLPAWRMMVRAGYSAWHLDTAELLSLQPRLVTPGTVVIAASQSGRSAELVTLSERMRAPAALIALTNDPLSPFAKGATAVIAIHSGIEHAVSTRSFLNTLAAAGLLAAAVTNAASRGAWENAADVIDAYLENWRAHLEAFKLNVGLPRCLMLLARGSSMAAALYGALIIKEAAKWPTEAMNAAQFRHGPLELADEQLTALLLPGEEEGDRQRNLRLARDIRRYGGKAFWLDSEAVAGVPHLFMPKLAGLARCAVEAVPLQLLSVALAEQAGVEPGVFRHLQKITVIE